MKYLNLFLLIILFPLLLSAQPKNTIATPRVDKRVELLSIVFRLAGNPEYNTPDNVKYVADIHRHFDKFIDDPLIKFARELRDSNGVSYDQVMSMAVYLKQPPFLDPIIPFTATTPDPRWSVVNSQKFVSLLKQFYVTSDCNQFFQAHAADYELARQRFEPVFKQLDASWYSKFYGKAPDEKFEIIIGIGNGGTNYGPHFNLDAHTKTVYAIKGSGSFDNDGNPVYEPAQYLPTLIHEFNHSFINYLTDKYEHQLNAAGQVIFEKQHIKMAKQAYKEWKDVMNESLVRASVIRYLQTHYPTDTMVADKELKDQLARGFVWMRPLVALLTKYEQQRKTYPTLESFMPQIIGFYNATAAQMDFYSADYDQNCAHIIGTKPFNPNDTTVSVNTTKIIFDFDKKLDGVKRFFGPGPKGLDHYPKYWSFRFTNDNKSIIMELDKLKPNTEYQVHITGGLMRTTEGYAVQDYLLSFKTGN